MIVNIYVIRCLVNGKVYVGKTINPKQRFATHRWAMRKTPRPPDCNVHLWNSCQKYGIDQFVFNVVAVANTDEKGGRDVELKWMDRLKSYDRKYGFNLRRDSSTKMITSPETRQRISELNTGASNPNYGNKWSDAQKQRMSVTAKKRHATGKYGEEWRRKISIASTEMWRDEALKKQMARSVSLSKRKYKFRQYTRNGDFLREWESVEEIISHNPDYKWQNIYSACNGYKPTYKGFRWEKIVK